MIKIYLHAMLTVTLISLVKSQLFLLFFVTGGVALDLKKCGKGEPKEARLCSIYDWLTNPLHSQSECD